MPPKSFHLFPPTFTLFFFPFLLGLAQLWGVPRRSGLSTTADALAASHTRAQRHDTRFKVTSRVAALQAWFYALPPPSPFSSALLFCFLPLPSRRHCHHLAPISPSPPLPTLPSPIEVCLFLPHFFFFNTVMLFYI